MIKVGGRQVTSSENGYGEHLQVKMELDQTNKIFSTFVVFRQAKLLHIHPENIFIGNHVKILMSNTYPCIYILTCTNIFEKVMNQYR